MLRGDNGVDDCGEVVDVGEGFNAKNNIIEGAFSTGRSFFRRLDDCRSS